MASTEDDERLKRLRAEAEAEMRRHLPSDGGDGAAKRRKTGGEEAERQAGGRFEYGAVRELATGISGFLLTCQLQRENSARKEAGPLLARYLERCGGGGSQASAAGGGEQAVVALGAPPQETGTDGDAAPKDSSSGAPAALSAVKVPVRGLVALKLAAHHGAAQADGGSSGSGAEGADRGSQRGHAGSMDAARANLVCDVAAALLADIAAGKQVRLQHVQRIVPVQTTCRLDRAALRAAGTQLAALVAAAVARGGSGKQQQGTQEGLNLAVSEVPGAADAVDAEAASQQPLTFGIGLKQREISGKPAAAAAAAPAAGDGSAAGAAGAAGAAPTAAAAAPAPDRGAILTALAGGFESALRQEHGLAAAVDLKAPDWVLICEVVPAGGELYAALCVLPRMLCTLKPKLHVRAVGRAGA